MANQRKKGIERITLTLPDDLLAKAEEEADSKGVDRLSVIREAIYKHLGVAPPKPVKKKKPQ